MFELDIGTCVLRFEQGSDTLARDSIITGADRPYWAFVWPSARALARVIGAIPDLSGKRVLDLGCGLGPLGLAAASRGAKVVLADIKPEAVKLALENAALNGLGGAEGLVLDWNHAPSDLGAFDGIVAADVFYDDGMLAGVLRFVRRHLAPGGIALIADPIRVPPEGVRGAARLSGLEASAELLVPGQMMTGGVNLFSFWRRPPPGATLASSEPEVQPSGARGAKKRPSR